MAQKYVRPTAATKQTEVDNAPVTLLYDKTNYTILAVSVLIVALGFFVMSGTTDIYSTAKIVVAPLIVLAGFGLGFYAILKKPAAK
ncbi:DUF3098 domain-containing protein [Mucilaginibacter myungsuensis]|uniref:DUF3098 domain-containing protein n=1 Tax=Mucilaginibacter myungsuensis TaxID=649104 RepID=A0A929PY49_9SPHI|nr:DUF3098 domain-containing protein [Mucilaginibacter myungsuensis]MBE9663861.1 DUF3098 domain-containing protein [Mucilaginibacter myungsuensis]MDN3598424.1 DUF3098 domain-containing protein [Mucilaginibacter myungsuensis]